MNQGNGRTTQTFRVTGFSNYADSLKKLASLNPDWKLSPEEIVDSGKAGQKIFKLEFTNRPVQLQPEDDNPNSIAVIIAGYQIGYISKEESSQVSDILNSYDIQSIACCIWGGQSRTVDEFCSETTQNQGISITVRIVYTDLSVPDDDDFTALLVEDEQPSKPAKKEGNSKKKKAKKSIFKRWWFWSIIIALLFGSCNIGGEPISETPPSTAATEAHMPTEPESTNANNVTAGSETLAQEVPTIEYSAVDDGATLGEKNALQSALNYIRIMPFSYSGLIEQLEYEGYSTEEATYGADNCGADWTEQALLSAKNYLRSMAFSYTGLIGQLEYEGFSTSDATYAADNCGADWFEQAAKSAENYLSVMSFSRQELIDQLQYEGYTYDQAVHGVTENGY